VIVDTSFIKNVFGRDCTGPSPFDRGRKATKVSAVVDEKGIPLSFTFHPGNRNDSRTLFHTLSKVPCDLVGRSLYADKIYDSKHCEEVIKSFKMENLVSKKKVSTPTSDNRIRIAVEHTFSWLDKFRRIILRYDGLVCHLRSFHYLAALHIFSNKLSRTSILI
jgi:transposase